MYNLCKWRVTLVESYILLYSGKSFKSSGTGRTGLSGASTHKSKNTMKAGLAVETMSAPNPFCPDTKVWLVLDRVWWIIIVLMLGSIF